MTTPTNPIEDPEFSYFTQAAWEQLGAAGRILALWNTMLFGRLTIGPVVMILSFLMQEKPSAAFERQPPMHNSWQKKGPTEEFCAYQAVRAVLRAYERQDETCAARGLTMMTQFPG